MKNRDYNRLREIISVQKSHARLLAIKKKYFSRADELIFFGDPHLFFRDTSRGIRFVQQPKRRDCGTQTPGPSMPCIIRIRAPVPRVREYVNPDISATPFSCVYKVAQFSYGFSAVTSVTSVVSTATP